LGKAFCLEKILSSKTARFFKISKNLAPYARNKATQNGLLIVRRAKVKPKVYREEWAKIFFNVVCLKEEKPPNTQLIIEIKVKYSG